MFFWTQFVLHMAYSEIYIFLLEIGDSSLLETICLPSIIVHCNDTIPKQIFPEKELHGLSPSLHIDLSVSDLYVYSHHRSAYSAAGKYVEWTDPGNI